jgi:hypothetical protein
MNGNGVVILSDRLSDWHPMHTAPRDGTLFWVWARGKAFIASWPHRLTPFSRKDFISNPAGIAIDVFALNGEKEIVTWNEVKAWTPIMRPEAPRGM